MATVTVEVTGWNRDGESLAWEGHGPTEQLAIEDAKQRSGIIEIGEVTIINPFDERGWPGAYSC